MQDGAQRPGSAWGMKAADRTPAGVLSCARRCVLGRNPAPAAAALRASRTIEVQGKLDGFSATTLVLAGERDVSTTPEGMSGITTGIAGAQYKEMPGTPHMPTLEQPQLVVHALDEFLPSDAVRAA